MIKKDRRKQQAKILRVFRKVHRSMGALLFVFFFFISITGVLLGWKKNSGGYILPKTTKGSSEQLKDWLPLYLLSDLADAALQDKFGKGLLFELNRIDVRKKKGVLKFSYQPGYWEVQLDGATGTVLNIGKRRSDLLENIHDGSILDNFLGASSGFFKLLYTSIIGVALLLFTITGFWLWYGPKQMRQEQRKR